MLDGSAGCIGRWNHFDEDGHGRYSTFPGNASFLGKLFRNWQVQR